MEMSSYVVVPGMAERTSKGSAWSRSRSRRPEAGASRGGGAEARIAVAAEAGARL